MLPSCLQSSKQQSDPEHILFEESLFLNCVFLYDLPLHVEGGAEDDIVSSGECISHFFTPRKDLGRPALPVQLGQLSCLKASL